MKKIAIFTSNYLPDIKAGGPVRSIENLVNAIGSDFIIHIITLDSLMISTNKSTIYIKEVGKSKVYYLKNNIDKYAKILTIVLNGNYDFIYINSFFDLTFSLYPLLISKLIRKQPKVIIAPRGQFSNSAITYKKMKKCVFLKLTKSINIYDNCIWHFTSDYEKIDVMKKIRVKESYIIPNINKDINANIIDKDKRPGELTIICVGRVSYMKNYPYLFECLKYIKKAKIKIKIIGNIENKKIYRECKEIASNLDDISVQWYGLCDEYFIENEINKSHLFVSPTLGENFGHSIYEAISLGCPVLISDNTPIKDLEQYNAGYVVPLGDKERFIDIINMFVDINNKEYNNICNSVIDYYNKCIKPNRDKSSIKYRKMFGEYR